jgi:serine/threonine protein phosphatase PrpC
MLISTVAVLHNNSAHGEDGYLVRTLGNHAFLDAVMDGVTGRQGGEASRCLVEALAAADLASPDDVFAVLEDVNQHCYRRGRGRFFLSTLSTTLFLDGKLYVMGVGDSPVYLLRSDAFQHLSSQVSRMSSTGVARAIGATPNLGHLYRTEVTIEPGDRLVLATDGITHTVTRDELIPVVRSAQMPDEAVQQLQTMMTTRHADNYVGARFRHDDWTAIFRFFE